MSTTISRPTPSLTAPSTHGSRTPRHNGRKRSETMSMLFTVPALAWFVVFMVGPLCALFYYSTLKWTGILAPKSFVGLGNFTKLFHDPVFWAAMRNTGIQLGVALPIMIVVSFMLAYYLNLNPPGHRVIRMLLFTPVLLSASALAMVFVGVFAPSGLVNGLLGAVGLDSLARPWLANSATALAAIIIIGLWSGTSVSAIMFAARLGSVPQEVYEAAELDGCGHWRRIWRIAWPICLEYVGVVTMLQFLWVLFNSAAIVLLLTKGGPGTSTATLSFLVYSYAFDRAQIGYSQAIAVVLFVIGVAGMVLIRRALRARY